MSRILWIRIYIFDGTNFFHEIFENVNISKTRLISEDLFLSYRCVVQNGRNFIDGCHVCLSALKDLSAIWKSDVICILFHCQCVVNIYTLYSYGRMLKSTHTSHTSELEWLISSYWYSYQVKIKMSMKNTYFMIIPKWRIEYKINNNPHHYLEFIRISHIWFRLLCEQKQSFFLCVFPTKEN